MAQGIGTEQNHLCSELQQCQLVAHANCQFIAGSATASSKELSRCNLFCLSSPSHHTGEGRGSDQPPALSPPMEQEAEHTKTLQESHSHPKRLQERNAGGPCALSPLTGAPSMISYLAMVSFSWYTLGPVPVVSLLMMSISMCLILIRTSRK